MVSRSTPGLPRLRAGGFSQRQVGSEETFMSIVEARLHLLSLPEWSFKEWTLALVKQFNAAAYRLAKEQGSSK